MKIDEFVYNIKEIQNFIDDIEKKLCSIRVQRKSLVMKRRYFRKMLADKIRYN